MRNAVPILEMDGVVKTFPTVGGTVHVLTGIGMTIYAGEFVALTGPSGSGKSTCLNLAALLDRPTSGRVVLDGGDVSQLGERELCRIRGKQIGMVFQRYFLLPNRSVFDNVLFRFRYLDWDRVDAQERVERILRDLDLISIAKRTARLLSGGEMQRVAIARAMAVEPRLLLADEPTGNLDSKAAAEIMESFVRLNDRGTTILMATHNQGLASLCARRLALKSGPVPCDTLH